MATVPATSKITKNGEPVEAHVIYNAILNELENGSVPVLDAKNFNYYSRTLFADADLLDKFAHKLIVKIVDVYNESAAAWENKYKVFFRGRVPNNHGAEFYAQNLVPYQKQSDMMEDDPTGVGFLFGDHTDKNDYKSFIKVIDEPVTAFVTVWDEIKLASALTTPEGLNDFIQGVFRNLNNSKEVYLSERIKKLIRDYAENPLAPVLTLDKDLSTKEGIEEFLVEMQVLLDNFNEFSKNYNSMGIDMHSQGAHPVLITTARNKANIKIKQLANMFHKSEEEVTQYIFVVSEDTFPEGVTAILTDEEFINIRVRKDSLTFQPHEVYERKNYFNNLHLLAYTNEFRNAVVIKNPAGEEVEEGV